MDTPSDQDARQPTPFEKGTSDRPFSFLPQDSPAAALTHLGFAANPEGRIEQRANEKAGRREYFGLPVIKCDREDDHCQQDSPFDCFLPERPAPSAMNLLRMVLSAEAQAQDAQDVSCHENDDSSEGNERSKADRIKKVAEIARLGPAVGARPGANGRADGDEESSYDERQAFELMRCCGVFDEPPYDVVAIEQIGEECGTNN